MSKKSKNISATLGTNASGPVRKPGLVSDELFKKMLDLQIFNYSNYPDITYLRGNLLLLFAYTDYLTKKGVNVIFFEMPVNSHLINLPYAKITRNEVNKIFPEKLFRHIPQDTTKCVTSDGLHLTQNEALHFTKFFKLHVSALDARKTD